MNAVPSASLLASPSGSSVSSCAWTRTLVLSFVQTRAESPLTEPERMLAVRLLGKVGSREDLGLLTVLSTPTAGGRVPRGDRVSFQESFTSIYRREGCHPSELRLLYRNAPVDFAAPIIWAVGAADTTTAFEHLALLIGEVEEADPLVLTELTRLGSVLPHPLPDVAAASTRGFLHSSSIEHLLVGIRATQEIEDIGATERLIELSDHRVRAVSTAATGALRQLSGIDRGRGSDRWKAWYEVTQNWWKWEAPDLLENIEHGNDAQASSALLELSKWRFHRHQISPVVARVLQRKNPELLVLACAVLGHLGSWSVVPALVETLADPNADIRSAAVQSLRRITDSDFGLDRKAWLEHLQTQS